MLYSIGSNYESKICLYLPKLESDFMHVILNIIPGAIRWRGYRTLTQTPNPCEAWITFILYWSLLISTLCTILTQMLHSSIRCSSVCILIWFLVDFKIAYIVQLIIPDQISKHPIIEKPSYMQQKFSTVEQGKCSIPTAYYARTGIKINLH